MKEQKVREMADRMKPLTRILGPSHFISKSYAIRRRGVEQFETLGDDAVQAD